MSNLQNSVVHKNAGPFSSADNQARFDRWWLFADQHGLHETEYLLPRAEVDTTVLGFQFEKRKIEMPHPFLSKSIEELSPWAYQFEFDGDLSTVGNRDDREWLYHRYRASMLVDTIKLVLGDELSLKSVLDVGCHCGPFSLEFACIGARSVTGVDLRSANIRQARWLAEVYRVPNVNFIVENARNLTRFGNYDITFTGGLFYHITFPIEFMLDVYNSCTDFAIIDTMAHKEPISAFHLIVNKNIDYSAEGESHYEFQPTYRALIDAIKAVGFGEVIEIIGSTRNEIPFYREGVVRSILAFKPMSKSLPLFKSRLSIL